MRLLRLILGWLKKLLLIYYIWTKDNSYEDSKSPNTEQRGDQRSPEPVFNTPVHYMHTTQPCILPTFSSQSHNHLVKPPRFIFTYSAHVFLNCKTSLLTSYSVKVLSMHPSSSQVRSMARMAQNLQFSLLVEHLSARLCLWVCFQAMHSLESTQLVRDAFGNALSVNLLCRRPCWMIHLDSVSI